MSHRDIGRLIDEYTERPLQEGVARLVKIRTLVTPPDFIMGFCASSDDVFHQVVDYIKRELRIPDSQETEYIDLKLLFSKGTYDLHDVIERKIPQFNEVTYDTVLLATYGFEHMPHYRSRASTLQAQGAAHLFTQGVKEDTKAFFLNTPPYYANLRKVVVVVTHIGRSLGDEVYRNAVTDADRVFRGNRYQDFNFELAH